MMAPLFIHIYQLLITQGGEIFKSWLQKSEIDGKAIFRPMEAFEI